MPFQRWVFCNHWFSICSNQLCHVPLIWWQCFFWWYLCKLDHSCKESYIHLLSYVGEVYLLQVSVYPYVFCWLVYSFYSVIPHDNGLKAWKYQLTHNSKASHENLKSYIISRDPKFRESIFAQIFYPRHKSWNFVFYNIKNQNKLLLRSRNSTKNRE